MQSEVKINDQSIAYTVQGDGQPVLLLHGFPQTQAMWNTIAPLLSNEFTVVTADLRGYGASSKPENMEEMSFRHMAADQIGLMSHLGFESFHLVGHDRGARTAYRLVLDKPNTVLSLTLMDIVPTHFLLNQLTHDVARDYYHWFFLAQTAPFPEKLIAHDPDAFFERCLAGWGGSMDGFDGIACAAYRQAWRDPDCIRSMCNDYRATIDIDYPLDALDLKHKVNTPAMVLYGSEGVMAKAYDVSSTWVGLLRNMQCFPIPGGHFFPDTAPKKTAKALKKFLKSI